MSTHLAPLVVQLGEGKSIAVVGDVYTYLATGVDTNGQYALFHAVVPPGGGPPPHIHSREDEQFYVLEGESSGCATIWDRDSFAGRSLREFVRT